MSAKPSTPPQTRPQPLAMRHSAFGQRAARLSRGAQLQLQGSGAPCSACWAARPADELTQASFSKTLSPCRFAVFPVELIIRRSHQQSRPRQRL